MSVVDGLPFKDDKKKYIVEVLDPVLEELVSDVLTELPKNPTDFMITWLRKRCGAPPSQTVSVSQKNQILKRELAQTTGSLAETAEAANSKTDKDDEEEEEEDDELDEIPESFKKSEAQLGKTRASVSAEAYGAWNKKKEFVAPSFPKTPEQKDRLKNTLQKSFMFADLEPKDMETIIMAMKEVPLEASAKVINEGENGDYLFVIESGSLDCIKKINGEDKVVKTCATGDVFGELALLYNAPRAASVVAKEKTICWQLDRDSFENIVKEAAVKRRDKYDSFLKSVQLLSSLGAYERSQIADALSAETKSKGDMVIKQDDPGDKFYIVEEGKLYASKDDKRVMDYGAGDYFGELALLMNQPRAASVIVDSDTAKVLSMSRVSFHKMLGPLQGFLTKQYN